METMSVWKSIIASADLHASLLTHFYDSYIKDRAYNNNTTHVSHSAMKQRQKTVRLLHRPLAPHLRPHTRKQALRRALISVDHPKPSLSSQKATEEAIDIHLEPTPASPYLPSPSNALDAKDLTDKPYIEREASRFVAVEAILESRRTPQDQKPRFTTLVDSGATMSLIRRSK